MFLILVFKDEWFKIDRHEHIIYVNVYKQLRKERRKNEHEVLKLQALNQRQKMV